MAKIEGKSGSDSTVYDLDRLQAGLFVLTTQYSLRPCYSVAARIVEQLDRLCNHPHIELIPEQNRVYTRMINLWRSRLLVNSYPVSRMQH